MSLQPPQVIVGSLTTAAMTDSAAPSTSSSTGRLHVHPHGVTHLGHPTQTHSSALEALEEDDHDYESLPLGYGWGTNMIAGAMVSRGFVVVLCRGIVSRCTPVHIGWNLPD